MMSKRLLSLTLTFLLILLSLSACNAPKDDAYSENGQEKYEQSIDTDTEPAKSEDAAYEAAKEYLALLPYSKQSLIDELVYKGDYPEDIAEAAVSKLEANGDVNWVDQAIQRAQYMDDLTAEEAFQELTGDYEQYTADEANAAIDAVYR